MSTSSRQFCDLGTQLVMESRRSTQTDTLLKYNDALVRSVLREQRDLEGLLTTLSAQAPTPDDDDGGEIPPALLIYQTAITRNKRCLLAYHAHRLERLRTQFWAAGCSLPHLLSDPLTRAKLSPHEADYLRAYASNALAFRSTFAGDLDLSAGVESVPKDLHVAVRVVRDCGLIQTESGAVDFKKGQRFMLRRADVEHLVVQGYLEEV